MVFNWFRRQFSDKTSDSQVEREKTDVETPDIASLQPEAETQTSESTTEAQSQQVAEDLLSYAKAAYKNIQQKQQQSQVETAPAVAESPATSAAEPSKLETVAETTEVETTEVSVEAETAQSVEAPATTTVEPEAPETSETPTLAEASPVEPAQETEAEPTQTPEPVVEAEALATDESGEPGVATAIAETGINLEAAPPELESAQPEVETAIAETGVDLEAVPSEASPEPAATESQTDETATAPVPFWAREDRQARLERLKATAIETQEPEPVRAPVQPAAATVETGAIPGLTFDEGFMWSAQVLAAQGRRAEDVSIEEITWLKRLRQGLDKTRRSLINRLKAIVGQGPLNQDAVMEIEALLLQADAGVEATDSIINTLQKRLRDEVLPPEQAIAYLKQILRDLLDQPIQESYSPTFVPTKDTLNIWLMTGVNGAGKTTTIGKISHLAQKSGYKCLIGAADTFRAAAVEQVKIWGQRSGVEVIANPGQNTDPAAVVFDAIAAAQARGTELLLIDTAGRLQNKKNLMDELSKIRRIVDKKAPDAQVEALLVLDATLGQNGLRQAQVFSEAAKLSGVVLTKLDGTAKGGVALAVVQQLGLPIRFIGAGEGIEDLRPFSSYEFVEALLSG
ncbi:signal recognition particle-docking protein FtsY [Coleofasciculus sp. FACHB-712]|uniref:signal recognition particle-docking protein FtsY n=1 Tax=Coleofasciculus sp. FACHB-712 TaxID=2692789 RepID=UPI001684E9EE|nr:signal recognition particle-docking protein FtsY [Coleofasciculus sp. FACHB-712]MBD1941107.1 signal recognition particle-docking protein FtsY [Coleofasciculus sp. FACHB-712]